MMRGVQFLPVLALALAAAGCGGGGGGSTPDVQSTRLTIKNSCSYDIWVQHTNGPEDINETQKIAAGATADYDIPDAGRASDRFWPKKGCDANGDNCTIGQSSDPCPDGGCPPPVDSKLEVTWGCTLSDTSGCNLTPQGDLLSDTYWNMSAVDGYTFPFKATVTENTRTDDGQACVEADCSGLTLAQCPAADDLSQGQTATHPEYASSDLKVTSGETQIGCYSPCKKLNYPTFGGENLNEDSDAAVMYCCPTPPISSDGCRAGPVVGTDYVKLIHNVCSDTVYGYAYDDAKGLRQCSAGTKVLVEFGPNCP